MTKAKTPADETYQRLCVRHAKLLQEAGALLADSLRTTPPRWQGWLAEQVATEANDVADQMKAWRLAHGWDA